jgi:LysR family nitrogen assimilation transcriptional regulator
MPLTYLWLAGTAQIQEAGMDIEDLREFIVVVDAGSLNKAALLIGVSQPAVSQRMSHLERRMKAKLLDRGPRGASATPVGRELYRGAQQVIRQFDRLHELTEGPGSGVRGDVVIGLPVTVSAVLVPQLYTAVKRRHPGIRLEFFEAMSAYIEELLAAGRLDLALLFRDDPSERTGETLLYSEDLYLMTASRLDDSQNPIPVRQLSNRPLVTPGKGNYLRTLIERSCAVEGITPNVVASVASPAAMVRIAQRGDASTILPLSAIGGYAGPALSARPIVEPEIRRWICVCEAGEFFQPRAAVEAVRSQIAELIHDLVAGGDWPGIEPVVGGTLSAKK